jgi:glutamine synthetase
MAADPQDAPRHAGQVVRRVLLRRNIAIDAETAQLVAALRDRDTLPASLAEAVDLLDADAFYRKAFGDTLISYLVMMKRYELGRYADALAEAPAREGEDVSDWEMREYFEFF